MLKKFEQSERHRRRNCSANKFVRSESLRQTDRSADLIERSERHGKWRLVFPLPRSLRPRQSVDRSISLRSRQLVEQSPLISNLYMQP